ALGPEDDLVGVVVVRVEAARADADRFALGVGRLHAVPVGAALTLGAAVAAGGDDARVLVRKRALDHRAVVLAGTAREEGHAAVGAGVAALGGGLAVVLRWVAEA